MTKNDKIERVSKSKYLKLEKEIRAEAKKLGYKIVIRKRPIIWNRFGSGQPNFGEASGFCDFENQVIQITHYGNISNGLKLFLLAHELRHAIQYSENLFQKCYWIYKNFDKLEKNYHYYKKYICKRTSFLAELDCNKFAKKWLIDHNIKVKGFVKYPPESTLAYRTIQHFEAKE